MAVNPSLPRTADFILCMDPLFISICLNLSLRLEIMLTLKPTLPQNKKEQTPGNLGLLPFPNDPFIIPDYIITNIVGLFLFLILKVDCTLMTVQTGIPLTFLPLLASWPHGVLLSLRTRQSRHPHPAWLMSSDSVRPSFPPLVGLSCRTS